ncbi:UNVERIFIED_CONTAM: hypothetical protein Slati_4442000 [Sesamum latifolium]|uniref:Transposase MuDR plant domain-containing protein n=1 Tax=Sesamum latifolium TaxID=2727402 RepID=A0AAW2SSC2_9LAMI
MVWTSFGGFCVGVSSERKKKESKKQDIRELHGIIDQTMFRITCSVNDSDVNMDISNDNDVLSMFGRNTNRVVFDVFVELAEEEGESGDEGMEEFGDESGMKVRSLGMRSHSELEDDPLKGSLHRDVCPLPSETSSKVKLEKGMIFIDINAFRKTLKEFVIQEGFKIMRMKNEKTRVTAHCSVKDCPWRIHAAPLVDGVTFQVKTYVPNHTCIRSDPTSEASVDWIATKIESVLRENPWMKTRGIRNELKKFGVNPQYMQICRAKKKTLELIQGSYIESFGKMPYYANLVLEKNEGSVVILQCDVDELEGLVETINEIVPHEINRRCARHIYANFRSQFAGAVLKRYFWQAARSYNVAGFNFALYKIKELKLATYE